jgi:hypothetical protein
VLPWTIYPTISHMTLQEALAPAALWEALWPVLVGSLLALVLSRRIGSLPRLPEGDLLAVAAHATPAVRSLETAGERIDDRLRQWPVAGALLVALTIVMAAALLLGS